MPLSLKRLRRRIRSVQSTKQITRAMEMVSAAKLRRCETQLDAARLYFTHLSSLLGRVVAAAEAEFFETFGREPLLVRGANSRALVLLLTADRGLCGAFNSNLIRRAEDFLKESAASEPALFCVGKKGYDYFRKRATPIVEKITDMRGAPNLQRIEGIADNVLERFRSAAAGTVYIIYNRFVSRLLQRPTLERLLPIDLPAVVQRLEQKGEAPEARVERAVSYIFEPDPAEVVRALAERYVRSRLYVTLAEHYTSEHAARAAAMMNATQNCDDLTQSLTLQLNKARQDSITKELLDIIGGAEALRT